MTHVTNQPELLLPEGPARLLYQTGLDLASATDLNETVQVALEAALNLTDAHYSVISVFDNQDNIQLTAAHGLDKSQQTALWETPNGIHLFKALNRPPNVFRSADLIAHARAMQLDDFDLPVSIAPAMTALLHHDEQTHGFIAVGRRRDEAEFSDQDEALFDLFRTQVSHSIAAAKEFDQEIHSRRDLETLIQTSPIGVCVFHPRTRQPVSFNPEAARIVAPLLSPDQEPPDLLSTATITRSDGSTIPLTELPYLSLLAQSDTVRSERIAISVPDGRSITGIINATPIRNDDDIVSSVVVTIQDASQIERSERYQTRFLDAAITALRNPLASVRGCATALIASSDLLDPAESLEYLRLIVQQSDQIRSIISAIADAARIAAGNVNWHFEPTNPASIVDIIRSEFLIDHPQTRMQTHLEPELPHILADRRRLPTAIGQLLNLVDRLTPPSSVINLSFQESVAGLDITISSAEDRLNAISLRRHLDPFESITSPDPPTIPPNHIGIALTILEAHQTAIQIRDPHEPDAPDLRISIPALTHTPHLPEQTAPHGSSPIPTRPYNKDGLVIHYDQRRITLHGQGLQFTTTEYAIIYELSSNAGATISHQDLLDRVWGPHRTGDIRSLRTHLRRIRAKLNDSAENPRFIFSEPRVGYLMPESD